MKKIFYSLLLCVVTLSIVSCGSNTDETILEYTTDNTLAVIKFDIEQIGKKLPKDEMLKDDSKKFSEDEKAKMKLFLNKDNGFDTDKPVYLLADRQDKDFAFSFFGWVKDIDKFKENFSKISNSKISVDKSKKLISADGEVIGSYDDDMVVFSYKMSNPINSAYSAGVSNSAANETFYTNFWKREKTENDNVVKQIKKSLGADADISSWINLYGMADTFSNGYIRTLALNRLLTDASMSASLNFEKGNIAVKTNTYLNDELQKLVEKYYDDKAIDYDIVNHIELDNAKAFGIGNFSVDFIKYLVKESGFEALANTFLGQQGLSFEEISDSFNGKYAYVSYENEEVKPEAAETEDVIAIAEDDQEAMTEDYDTIAMEEEEYDYDYPSYGYSQPNFLIAIGINGDKAQKIVDMVKNQPMISNMYHVYSNKEVLVVSSAESSLALLESGKDAKNDKLDKKSGLTSYTWVDGKDMNNVISMSQTSKVTLKSMESQSKIEGGNLSSEVTIKLTQDDKNALHYIMGYE